MERGGYKHQSVSLEEAIKLIEENVHFSRENHVEEIPLMKTLGRICAKDMAARLSQPPFDRSPLDGYALRASDTYGASKERPVRLRVVEERMAGDGRDLGIMPGEAVRIMTGAPIPAGANCVIRQESTDYGEEIVAIYKEMSTYDNFCCAGEDFKKGDCLIRKNTKITAIETGILASMGYGRVTVYKKPKIALFTTGDELLLAGEPLKPGKIYNSNLYLIWGRLKELGIEPYAADMLPDIAAHVAERIKKTAGEADLIVTTGGVSVGKKDIMHEVFELLDAQKIFWRVAIKPGTPSIFCVVDNTPVISLSGNPFGAVTNLELLVRPALAAMTGLSELKPVRTSGTMADAFLKESPGRRFIRAICREGEVHLPKGKHASGVLGSMQGCNCLVEIDAGNKGLEPGDNVRLVLLNGRELSLGDTFI